MNKFVRFSPILLIEIVMLFLGSCNSHLVIGTDAISNACINSFQEFAYSGSDIDQTREISTILPPYPWQVEAVLPTYDTRGYSLLSVDTEVTRSINGSQEVWIVEHLSASEVGNSNKNVFMVYQTESHDWKTISADIQDSGFIVGNLFVTSDGSLWGQTVWDTTLRKQPAFKKIPVLSKFNENTQRFEFAEGVLEIPWVLSSYNFFPWPQILVDNDTFWFFVRNDGLYWYDPSSQETEKRANLLNSDVTQAALSTDGSIYFEIYSEKIYSEESFFRLSDGMLFQFFPETDEIIPMNIPDGKWPIFTGMLVDIRDRLWLGATGYQEQNGEWKLIYPNPQNFFEHAGDIYWAPPTLILASSNGILWYKKFLDDTRANGTAWYDPQTGKGCMFTNLAVNVIEDSEQQLWLVAGGKLYKNKIN